MKTFDEIYDGLCADYTLQTGVTLNSGGDMAIRLRAMATQLHSLWVNADFVRRQMFPQLAQGEYLDYHAQLRGIERTPAAFATGRIGFYINEPRGNALSIAEGVRCFTGAGVQFLTVEPCVIEAGSLATSAAAVAETAGAGGNVPVGSILQMTKAPVGVTGCGNAAAFTGGEDEESDEYLRARVLTSYKRLPNGANASYYETQVLGMQGVAAVAVKPRARGLGTVDIVVASQDGIPGAEALAKIEQELQKQREICVSIQVRPPVTRLVDIAVAIEATRGYDLERARGDLAARISEYFCGELLEKTVSRARLGEIIFHTEGVENYSIIQPAADIPAGEGALPVLGTLDISEMG